MSSSPPARDIVVVGASAGGVEALRDIVAALPPDYPGAICVVLHIPPQAPSVLPRILDRAARVRCVAAEDGAPLRAGRVYVAPPDHHLLVEPGRVRVLRGPRENGHRPAVDPLFRTAARSYGRRVVGVVLTGNLDDGTRGLREIVRRGGVAVAQAPDDAPYPSMPRSAIAHVAVDHVLAVDRLGPLLADLARGGDAGRPSEDVMAYDDETATGGDGAPDARPDPAVAGQADRPPEDGTRDDARERAVRRAGLVVGGGRVNGGARVNESLGGVVSGFTCPECHGALWELRDGDLARYRCRVGHSFSERVLVEQKSRSLEDALWTALTALEESAAIAERAAARAAENGHTHTAEHFRRRAEHIEQRSELLRDALGTLPASGADTAGE